MRILFISPNLGQGGGGAERQIVTVACLLKDAGHEVEFLCYVKGDFYSYILEEKQIPIHWHVLPNYLKRMFWVRKFVRNGRYDAVISFLWTPNFLNNFAAMGGKSWKVITGERSAKESSFHSKKGKMFCWFQRYADYIVCNSDNARQMWLRHYPKYVNKLVVIYNCVTLQPVTTQYVPKRDGKLHVIVAASYQRLKNTMGLINALALLSKEERERIHVDWYGRKEICKGDTQAYDESIEAIRKYELRKVISLHEDTKVIYDRMKEADVVALFSKYEGLPNAICEGMALSKPIIMTRVSDYKILVDEFNGLLCDWDDAGSIKDALSRVINLRKEELLLMGKSSKRKAKSLFEKDKVLCNWENVLKGKICL